MISKIYKKYRFLLLRRFFQFGILFLYFGANAFGWNILKGNLSSSIVFDFLPLSDPFAVLQMFSAGAVLGFDVLLGAIVVFLFYGIFAGRAFCSFVCPINIISDFSAVVRRKLGFEKIERKVIFKRNFRYFILILSLVVSFICGVGAYEMISPIGIVTRGIVFGGGMMLGVVACIVLFDVFVQKNGWCGYVCPLGAFYASIGKFRMLKVTHDKEKCTKCFDCKLICPESQVLGIIGKKSGFIKKSECISCGRCIEVCNDDALHFSFSLNKKIGESDEKK